MKNRSSKMFQNTRENEFHDFRNFGYLALEKFGNFFKGACTNPEEIFMQVFISFGIEFNREDQSKSTNDFI